MNTLSIATRKSIRKWQVSCDRIGYRACQRFYVSIFLNLQRDLKDQKASFSEIAKEEIQQMEDVCIDCFRYAIEALEERSKEKAMKVIEKESQADELEIALRTAHMKRLARMNAAQNLELYFWMHWYVLRESRITHEILQRRF